MENNNESNATGRRKTNINEKKSPWDNSTCNACKTLGENYAIGDSDGERYCICGECYHNPIHKPNRKSLLWDDDDDDEEL